MDLLLLMLTCALALAGGIGALLVFVVAYVLLVVWLWQTVACGVARIAVACYRRVTGRSEDRAGSVHVGEHDWSTSNHLPGSRLVAAWRRKPRMREDFRPPRPVRFGAVSDGRGSMPEDDLYISCRGGQDETLVGAEPAVTVPSFKCPACGAVSHHPIDVKEGYCGRCHDFTGRTKGWPANRLAYWPADLQVKELGGIIVDDLVVKEPADPEFLKRLEAWKDALDGKGTYSLGVPNPEDIDWLLELVSKARETGVAPYVKAELIDGGIRVRKSTDGEHYIDLIKMPMGVWYLFWTPVTDGLLGQIADRSWAYKWDSTGERPFRRACLAALDWDGGPDTEPVKYTERLA